MAVRMDSRIEVQTMTVALHKPNKPSRKSTMRATSAPAATISCRTSEIESFTKVDASSRSLIFKPFSH